MAPDDISFHSIESLSEINVRGFIARQLVKQEHIRSQPPRVGIDHKPGHGIYS
jgi:hypothetical protein